MTTDTMLKREAAVPRVLCAYPSLTSVLVHQEEILVTGIWGILTFRCLLCSTPKATQGGLTKR